MIIGDTLERNRALFGNRMAVSDGAEKRYSYGQFVGRVHALMHTLYGLGLKPGDRVACLMSNVPEYMEFYFAVPMGGMVILPLNYRLGPEELTYILNDAGAAALVFEPLFAEVVEAVRPAVKSLGHLICLGETAVGGALAHEALISHCPATRPAGINVHEGDIADLSYTSGTTGRPKGVMLTHTNIMTQLFNVLGYSHPVTGEAEETWLVSYPAFHVGVIPAFAGLTFGVSNILTNFGPHMYELIEKEKVNCWFLPPVMLEMMELAQPDPDRFDLSSVSFLGVAGQPSRLVTVQKAFSTFSHPNLQYITSLGVTETFSFNTLSHITRENLAEVESLIASLPVKTDAVPAGLHGTYPHVAMKIVDADRNPVVPGVVGEIAFKGNHVMKGYWKNPEATTAILENGWYYTGDMGLWHPDRPACSFVVDRAKDMIVSGSENIYPAEVELAISQFPGVASVCVFGVPDEKWGETVNAAVVMAPGQAVTGEEIINFCKTKIASYKKPTAVHFIDELPRNTFGKVLKRNLQNRAIQGNLS